MDLIQFMLITDELHKKLQDKFSFDSNGWPVFRREHFLDEWPKDMVTFEHKNSSLIAPKKETLLCFYTGDIANYRRFKNIYKDILIYKQYKGVVFPDITVTYDMDNELQEMIMLANQMFAAFLAINGIKIVFNTRCGSKNTIHFFKNIPQHVMCASGFLGCKNSVDPLSAAPYINKILRLMPKKLVIYGKHDRAIDEQLELLGIDYRYYADFHTRSLSNSNLNRRKV